MIDHFGFWYDQPIACIDFETTGTAPTRGDRIVEMAVVRIERMKIVRRWRSMVNPERSIPEEASLVHHIYEEDVARAPIFGEVAENLIAECRDAIPCAYNESFDRGFLMAEFWNAGLATSLPLLTWPRWLDLLTWVRSVDRFVTTSEGERVSNALVAACARRGIVIDGEHGALGDASALAQLVVALQPDMPRCTSSELIRRQPFLAEAYERRVVRR